MFDARYAAFAALAALLVISPGATLAVVVETALGHGRRAALLTVFGRHSLLCPPFPPPQQQRHKNMTLIPVNSPYPNSLAGKNVLVTGGAGFVGSHIVDQLIAHDVAAITVIDNMVRGRPQNLADALKSGRVTVVEGDICDQILLDRLVSEADIVFHQAALRITHCAAEPRLAFDVMGRASFEIFDACVRHKVEKLIAASSASIYGLAPEFPTTEAAAPYADRTLYGGLKMLNESLLRAFNDMFGLNYVAMRYFNVFGPRMDIHGKYTEVLIRWMERISQGLPPLIFGDGLQTMDFIDVRDIARANIAAALSPTSDRVYNVAWGGACFGPFRRAQDDGRCQVSTLLNCAMW